MWVFKPLVAEDITNLYDSNFDHHKLLQGLMISMQNLGGTVFYFISGSLIRKFGHTKAFLLGHVSLGLHFVLYYTISNPWYILPLELLHGPSYALLSATAASYAAKVAPPHILGRLQATQQFVFFSGYAIAGFAGGYVYNNFGGCLTFLLTGCFVFAFALFYALCKTILKLKDRLASVEASVSVQEACYPYNLYPTPPPSPLMNKSNQLASLDDSFMEDFKELVCSPVAPKCDDVKSSMKQNNSFTSLDSGCHDMEIKSIIDEDGFRSSATPRKTSRSTPKGSIVVDIGSECPRQNSLNKSTSASCVESVTSLSPSFRVNTSISTTGRSNRKLSFWDSPRVPSEKDE